MVGLALALTNTLASFLFEQYLYSTVEYDIDNAPSWFYQEAADEMCTFTYKTGKLESIEIAKQDAHDKMVKRIEKIVIVSVDKYYEDTVSEKEQLLLDTFSKDRRLTLFVDANLRYIKVKHEDNADVTFVKACIPKQQILDYQKKRLGKIQHDLTLHRADQAFDDLDKEFGDTGKDDW